MRPVILGDIMSSNTMSRNRANLIRLFVEVPLAAETQVELPAEQAHYVANVMRRKPGD